MSVHLFLGSQSIVSEFYENLFDNFSSSCFQATVTLPDNVTITLMKTGSSENTTEMRVGSKISFLLKILFPQTTTDMLVELFAPDNDTIVMMLCDVKVQSIGSNLAHTGAAQIVMDSQNSSTVYVGAL